MRFRSAFGLSVSVLGMLGLSACTQHPSDQPTVTLSPAGYQLTQTLPISGEGRWDFVTYDPANKVLYVPRSTHTQVIRPATGEVVADIANTDGVHGVALVPELGRGFTSNGKPGTVTVFDMKTYQVIGTVPAGKGPDAIIYDAASKKVFCFNAKGNSATVIDPSATPEKAAVGTIEFGSNPECAVTDGKGKMYLNLEDTSEIVTIDTKAMKVVSTWKIEGGEAPTGLAIDRAHHVLFSGCHNKVMAVIDTETGKTLTTLPIGEGVDGCGFDAATGEAFASCGDGTITGITRSADGQFKVAQTISTKPGARTMTIDPATHTLYLPTAEFQPKAEGEKRPQMKPGTFMILVVTPKT